MQKEYIVSKVEFVDLFYLSNMDDFADRIKCSNDPYWSSVEGQLFYEDEFRVEDDVAYPTINDIPNTNFGLDDF
jgi:hypothetical protein